jgi:hypothetical protein
MPDFCDWSPCSKLLGALGRYVFGDPITGEYKVVVATVNEEPRAITVDYCPFCGTRLTNLQMAATGQITVLPDTSES